MATYLNGIFAKKGKFSIKLSGNADIICSEIQKNKKANGSIRLELKERKEPDKNGNTHYITVDEWEPTAGYETEKKAVINETPDIDSLPF